MNMIEKVARAMAERSQARVAGLPLLNAVEMDGKENFMLLAEAAIEAMREPTGDMLDAQKFGLRREFGISAVTDGYLKRIHGLIIDAALKEE